MMKVFKIFDKDGSGTISKEEMKDAFGGGDKQLVQQFEQMWNEMIEKC
jgi:Ca2+-binding EF-hand superfamily protein